MEDTQHRQREMFLRLKDFSAAHIDIPATTIWPQLVLDLNSVVAALESHVTSEQTGKGAALSGTTTRAAAREALREDIEAIVRTARVIGEEQPGFDDKFRMPRGANDAALVNLALGIAAVAADPAVKAEFISHGLPCHFLNWAMHRGDIDPEQPRRSDGREAHLRGASFGPHKSRYHIRFSRYFRKGTRWMFSNIAEIPNI